MNQLVRSSLVLSLAMGVCLAGSSDQRSAPEVSALEAQALLDRGLYEQAEIVARIRVEELSAQPAGNAGELGRASDILVAALLLNGKGAAATTLRLASHTLRTVETRLGTTHPDLVPPLNNLSAALVAAGEYPRAVESARRAVTLAENHRLADLLADSLDHLGAALIAAERYAEASSVLQRSLTLRESAARTVRRPVARTLMRLGRALQAKGDYEQSAPLMRRALTILEPADQDHPSYAEALNLVGLQLWFEGKLSEANDYAGRAVAAAERTLRLDHPTTALALRYKAGALLYLGDMTQSHALLERALNIAERTFGPVHFETWAYVNDLAMAEMFMGRYTVARSVLERALTIAQSRAGQRREWVATTMVNLAEVDARLGDYAASRTESVRAISIWQQLLGRDHPFVAQTLVELAAMYRGQGAASEALPLVQRALAIRERVLGPDHRSVATTLADLAASLRRLNRLTSAQDAAARAVRIWEQTGAEDAPEFAAVLKVYADLQAERGDAATARLFYDRALTIEEKAMGRSHPMFADTQVGLATALADLGERRAAITTALEAEEAGRNHLRLMIRDLPERQSLGYATKRPRGLDLAMSLADADAAATRLAFDALIRSRRLVLDEMAARRRVRVDSQAAGVAPQWAALTSARQRLANLVVRGPGELPARQYADLVEDARRAKEAAEGALASRSAAFRDEQSREEIDLEQVRKALPAGSALVAFARFTRTLPVDRLKAGAAAPAARRDVPSYLAFVMRKDRPEVSMVPIGPARIVEDLVSSWRREATGILRTSSAAQAEHSYRAAGTRLRQRVWDPLAASIGDATTVFVVPDGSLDMVSLAALPAGQRGYVVEQGPGIHYLSAERDLVAPALPSSAGRALLALGGAAFDDESVFTGRQKPPSAAVAKTERLPARLRGDCGELDSLRFRPLHGTTQEVREVAKLWTGASPVVLERQAASERAFKQLAPGHRVIHLATHGFFLDGRCDPSGATTRGVGGLSAAPRRGPAPGTTDNPLLLSGLALAGANRRSAAGPKDEDGILTAEEVASLNLNGVEWAVLSACDTGLGVVKAGEGVFGLRRAFQVAGVRTVIMSLWSVEDGATRAWMSALYEGRLRQGLTTAAAVNHATLSVLRARRAAKQTTHPFYWAGFVAAGDWR